jgi:hypothetical protein
MNKVLRGLSQLATWKKIVVGGMAALVVLTWLAVCLILLGVIGP